MPKKLTLQPYARKQIDMIVTILQAELFKAGFSRENARLKRMSNKATFTDAVFADKGQHEDTLSRFVSLAPTIELLIFPREVELPFPHE